ncbi:type IX secretion system membrane protein PorP/SprF [Flavobacteriaceae bacterium]|nr:type IX secretion system membrane protein PorP/SprF [Flavobacteriaceae bacterium]
MKKLFLIFIGILTSLEVCSQQDSQYTQYIYNTMSVNSAYTGQRDVLSYTGLYRTQWVGIDGAPKTLTFGIHSPLKNENLAMGISIVSDQLGPIREDYINLNFSYTIRLNRSTELSFGLKGGLHNLSSDFSRGNSFQNTDVAINENISLFSPTVGAGLYLHSTRGYLGLSTPNFLTTEHYNDYKDSLASERLHLFLIGGYVFNIDNNIKLKPAFLIKAVSGSPLIADLSINAMFNNRFVFGLAYRWDDSLSGLTGLQVNKTLFIGYAYDYNTSMGYNYTGGTHEVMLRFELQQINKILSPRFF